MAAQAPNTAITAPTAPPEEAATLIDNQDASPLFNIPLELRRAIYTHLFDFSARHVYSMVGSDGTSRLHFVPCIAPGASDADDLDGSERCPDKPDPETQYPIAGPIFKRRLLSSWGPHWMCQEMAFHPEDCSDDSIKAASSLAGGGFSLLRVCKRMFLELVDDVTATTDFHVADLRTLRRFVENTARPHTLFGFEALDRSRISMLSITISQDLAFFQAMSKLCKKIKKAKSQDGASKPSPNTKSGRNIKFWPCLPSALPAHLPALRKFHLWLDHNCFKYWSAVNERAILAPVEDLGMANPELELICVLPRVHPKIENSQRHYLPDDGVNEAPTSSQLRIRRILRQRYRVFLRSGEPGNDLIRSVDDFPHTYSHTDPGGWFGDMARAEREEYEASGWRRGVNVITEEQIRSRRHYSRMPAFFQYC
ncbi:hypothetical protein QBC39DRAFT_337417 [Podospora conica]|nr:hypothetical protein QBC39DRAFT_337417 [Schizothecium conicum]